MQQFSTHLKTSVSLILVTSISLQATQPSLLRYVLGSQPVSTSIQRAADAADEATDFKTPVLKMNRLAKLFGYSSFNWFDTTWVNEEAAQEINPKILTWQLIHEKYHSLARHDVRRIFGFLAATSPYFITAIQALVEANRENDYYGFMGDVPFIDYLVPKLPLIFLTHMLINWHEEYCENAADQYADRITTHINNPELEKYICPQNLS
jgi:hypothetical protein